MPIIVVCEACGKKLQAPDRYAGYKAKCSHCGAAVVIGAPDEAAPSKPKPPKHEASVQPLPSKFDVADAEEVQTAQPAEQPERPKRKKNRKKKPRSRSEGGVPSWAWWTGGVVGSCAAILMAVVWAIHAGFAALVILIGLHLAIMLPISIVVLIISMFISSAIVGGVEFGEVHVVIPKALALLFVVDLLYLIPCVGGFCALPIWFIGLMLLFRLEIWETRVLVAVNWVLNWVVFIFGVSLLITLIQHATPPGAFKVPHMPASAQEAKDLRAIDALGGRYDEDEAARDKPIVSIDLSMSPATDADLERVARFPKLRRLKLDSTKISDAGLERLKGLAELRTLDLSHTQITDAGLEHLKGLNGLEELTLIDTKATPAGIKELRKALPGAKIILREEDSK